MGTPFAVASDLADRWRPLSTAEQAQATILLADASTILRAECPDVDERLAADPPTLDSDLPVMIVCAMVKRAMIAAADAAGVGSVQQTAGPFSQSQTFTNPMGNLYLTKAERRLLGCGGQRAATVPMYQVPVESETPWWVTL